MNILMPTIKGPHQLYNLQLVSDKIIITLQTIAAKFPIEELIPLSLHRQKFATEVETSTSKYLKIPVKLIY